MFKEIGFSPEEEASLKTRHVIVAHSRTEVYEKTKDMLDCTASLSAIVLDKIIEVWKGREAGWSVLNGMKVLDLASGSGLNFSPIGTIWFPHFARLCAVNGASVTVIDSCDQIGFDAQNFTWAACDLVRTVADGGIQNLPVLKGKRFDLINSTNFIGKNPVPGLGRQLAGMGISYDSLEDGLFEQAGELLAEGGIMALDTRGKNGKTAAYVKEGNRLVEKQLFNF